MPYEIVNSKRSKSVIRVTAQASQLITLPQLSTNTTSEVITGASITHFISTGDGAVKVYRGDNASGVLVIDSVGSNDLPFAQYDVAIANTSSANIYVTNSSTNGTVMLIVSKTATYEPALTEL